MLNTANKKNNDVFRNLESTPIWGDELCKIGAFFSKKGTLGKAGEIKSYTKKAFFLTQILPQCKKKVKTLKSHL